MFKKEYFRIFLVSLIFSLSVLVALPRIPFEVDNFWYTTVSYIGGYEFTIPKSTGDKTISLKDFNLGMDIGGGSRVVVKMESSDSVVRDRIVSIVKKRLQAAGIVDYKINLSSEDPGSFSVDTPKRVSSQRTALLVYGNGDFTFKQLKPSIDWNTSDFQKYIADENAWDVSDITERDVIDIASFINTYGESSIQMTFSEEGVKKFRILAKNNIGKPVGFYINGVPSPFSLALISEAVALDTGNSISFSGGFQKQSADDFILQRKFPFSENLEITSISEITPRVEINSVLRYGIAFLVGMFLSILYLIIRYRYLGITHGVSILSSLALLIAVLKIFSVEINVPAVLGVLILTFYMTDVGFSVSRKMHSERISGKPLDLASFQVFDKEKSLFRIPLISSFALMMFLYPFNIGTSKQFALVLVLGMLISLYFYSFSIKTLINVFGGEKK